MSKRHHPLTPNQLITIEPGQELTITPEMIMALQPARRVPTRGGLPFVLILQPAHRKYGHRTFVIPKCPVSRGFVVFMNSHPVGTKIDFPWIDATRAALVPVGEMDDYVITDDGVSDVSDGRSGDNLVSQK